MKCLKYEVYKNNTNFFFQFQNRDESLGDDYSIPHWINLRFICILS